MVIEAADMNCRICGAPSARIAGEVEYYADYEWKVCDCSVCRCRFTKHDNSVYEMLHTSGVASYYNDYRTLAADCKRLFDQRDLAGLKHLLSQVSKYRFVLDELEREPIAGRLLEIGCSRGYLTSYFILAGRHILGVDVSEAALEGAREAFGEHFALAGSSAVDAGAPYDVIYHVGMIGCVADPVGLTRKLLAMLKPGGRLLFNAPNLRGCYLRGQLWFDSAPPPDVVTLFPAGFWKRQLADLANVDEHEQMCPANEGLAIGLRKMFGRRWAKPKARSLARSHNRSISTPETSGRIWRSFERAVLKAGRLTGFSRLAPRQPSEFGLYVAMTKKGNGASDSVTASVAPGVVACLNSQ